MRDSEGALLGAERDDIDLDDAALLARVVPPVEPMEAGEQTRPEEAERLGDFDALGAYLREAGRFSLLTAEQEVGLAKRIESGQRAHKRLLKKNGLSAPKRRECERLHRDGEQARHEMIQANLRLVISMARRYRWTGLPLLDLIQEGNIGLMRGVDRYDWRKGFKFATYATWWVRQAIQRGVSDRGRVIRLPVNVHDLLVRVGRTRIELEQQLAREATDEEVARSAWLSVARVQELRGFAAYVLSLETPVGDDGDATLGEFVPDEAADLHYEEVLSRIGRDEAIKVLSTLNKREGTILALRFGLTGEDPLTLDEVGNRFGLTHERIRQVEAKALAKLRHPSRSAALRTETYEAGRAT